MKESDFEKMQIVRPKEPSEDFVEGSFKPLLIETRQDPNTKAVYQIDWDQRIYRSTKDEYPFPTSWNKFDK